MATITPVKTELVAVLSHQAAAHPITIVGSDVDCLTKRAVTIFMYHGYIEAAADTNPGAFKVQVRPDAGDGVVTEHWITVAEFVAKGTTPDDEVMTAIEAVGVKVLAVAATAGFVAGDLLYIQDIDTLASSEWAECQEIVTNTSIDVVDGVTVEKSTAGSGCTIFNDASKFVCTLDLNANESFRVIWMHEGAAGANGHIKALAITHDSDSSV